MEAASSRAFLLSSGPLHDLPLITNNEIWLADCRSMANATEPVLSTATPQPSRKKRKTQHVTAPFAGANDKPQGDDHFRILDLPAELVVRVIEQAVILSTVHNPIRVRTFDAPAFTQPAITRTCRLFRVEGLPLFYKHNYFKAYSAASAAKPTFSWLRSIGKVNASMLQHCYLESVFAGAGILEIMTGGLFLQEMRGHAREGDNHSHGRAVEWAFIRQREGKIVLGSGAFEGCYELSFGDVVKLGDSWERMLDIASLADDGLSLAKLVNTDWWIRDDAVQA